MKYAFTTQKYKKVQAKALVFLKIRQGMKRLNKGTSRSNLQWGTCPIPSSITSIALSAFAAI